MNDPELQSYIDSVPRVNLKQAKEVIFHFADGIGRLESYTPGYGKLKLLLSKGSESLMVSLSECHDFSGLTEFSIGRVVIEPQERNLKQLVFGEGDFQACFESLVFLVEK